VQRLKAAFEWLQHLLLTDGSGATHRYTLQGSVKDLAFDLCLAREALYRTLSSTERAGVIARDATTLAFLR
jgi:hypothetical protein